ncbi:hypothetical protein CMO88_01620 [Candidatus Woesearchaeota archaeon]|nr:hypothetical protein [Candidatus Woesearchaeota archaeon]|tara:strand:- start:2199 stop:2747 length:549 start_codon:yes stop_codon:yes gene_type:complete
MGLERVKGKVLEEAKLKAKSRLDSANTESKNILQSFSKQAREKETIFRKKLDSEVESIKRREDAAAKLESKKLTLAFRKEFVDETFSIAREKLSQLPDSERASHIKKMLEKAKSEIDIAIVHCNKKDRKFVSGYKVKETDILGGIIAESANGTLRVDYSYETLLNQLKGSLLPKLNKVLFEK